jgi:hypothetical protein
MKKDIYEPIRRMTKDDRRDIYLFAIERSKEILSKKDVSEIDTTTNRTAIQDLDANI